MTAVEADLRAAVSLQSNDWIITLIQEKITFYFDINAAIQTTLTDSYIIDSVKINHVHTGLCPSITSALGLSVPERHYVSMELQLHGERH